MAVLPASPHSDPGRGTIACVTIQAEGDPFTRAREAFARSEGSPPAGIAFAPGRVNLVGEHTDYNDGFVLPMAIEQGIAAAFAPNAEDVLRVHASDIGDTTEIPIASLRGLRLSESGWFRYVGGMAATMIAEGVPVGGTTMALASNLPSGAGLSSSAALELVVGRALTAAAGADWDPRRMSVIAQRAEQEFAGVACGIMDQMAVACARAGRALLLDCRSLDTSDVLIPEAARIVIVNSGVRRALASSAYNERRAACERAVAAVSRFAPGVRALRDVDEAALAQARDAMDDEAFRRASHVIAENRRPAQCAEALERGDLESAGRVMLASHASLRDLYDVSCPELDLLVELSMAQPGCHGARLTGAGFGGCTIALVDVEAVDNLVHNVARDYGARTQYDARVIVARPADGARVGG
jgi:galactokinase